MYQVYNITYIIYTGWYNILLSIIYMKYYVPGITNMMPGWYIWRPVRLLRSSDICLMFVFLFGVFIFILLFLIMNFPVFFVCRECVWVINVEAQATHCRMASTIIILQYICFISSYVAYFSGLYVFSLSMYLGRRRAYVVLLVSRFDCVLHCPLSMLHYSVGYLWVCRSFGIT